MNIFIFLYLFIIPDFFFRKKGKNGILISCQSRSVIRLSVCLSVRLSVRAFVRHFLVNVSPPKPLEVATSNFVVE